MSGDSYLKGITWDHPRGYQPLEAIATKYHQETGIRVEWKRRSLKEFGDMPMEELINRFDLIVLDHPYMGQAWMNELLLPMNEYLSKPFLEQQERLSVGPSFQSYIYKNKLFALPIDSAAMVTAYSEIALGGEKKNLPVYLSDIAPFAQSLPVGQYAAMALCPTDIWCVFLSVCAQLSNGLVFTRQGIPKDLQQEAFLIMNNWKSFLHPISFELNAIQLLDAMSTAEELVYAPFVFGYSNYSRKGFRDYLVHFANVPRIKGVTVSSVLGGAGIAISQVSSNRQKGIDFLHYCMDPELYAQNYIDNGGQSAHISDWENAQANLLCHDFFRNTKQTLQDAYLRPRMPGFNRFQEQSAELVYEQLTKGKALEKTIALINEVYQENCKYED